MITTLLSLASLAAPAAATTPPPGEVKLAWKVDPLLVQGQPFRVMLVAEAPEGGDLEAWKLSLAALSVDGKALAEKSEGKLPLYASGRAEVSFDLVPYLAAGGSFELSFDPAGAKQSVRAYRPAPKETAFMNMPAGQLGGYLAVLETSRGTMVAEVWPDVAPNHVRNFLDLCHTGFYDGLLFHRVIPGFMIQGGDPLTRTPRGAGAPRVLDAEFNQKKHVRGVLSMARTNDPNSASSQFFVCHDTAPHLDNQYTAFGQLLSGFEALDLIVTTKRAPDDRPTEPQRIVHAYVLELASGK